MSEAPPNLDGVLNRLRALLMLLVLGTVACAGPAPDPDFPPTPAAPHGAATASATTAGPDRPQLAVPMVVPGSTPAPKGRDGSGYLDQRVRWDPCTLANRTFECAQVLAPLDWTTPDELAISLFLLRSRATQAPRLGTIFVNPGGPGEPGSALAARFPRTGLEQYDVVGWDPRGTGQSAAVQCADGEFLDDFFEVDTSPDDPGERAAYIEANRRLGQSCLERSGRLLQHISTLDTVYDLDLLRRLLDEDQLNYFGYSYGTKIGSRYAHLFPARVGRMALDAAVNVTDSEEVIQAVGFERALEAFAEWCVAQRCELGTSPDEVLRSVTGLFDDLDARPLPVGERRLTQSQALTGVLVMLYGSTEQYRTLLAAIDRARAGDGALLLQLADSYNSRSADGSYDSRQTAFNAIRCLDKADEGLAGADRAADRQNEKAPVLGPYFGPDYTCPTWPVPPRPPDPPVRAVGAPPILVIGTTGDSATPYEFAVGMAEQLESGVLLTFDGPGHGAYGGNSECVDRAVVAYFTGDGPPPEQTCR